MRKTWLNNLLNKGRSAMRKPKKSLFLLALLFILSMTIPPVVAQVYSPIPIVQTQQTAKQLANEARALYEDKKWNKAAEKWSETASAFAAGGDYLNQAMALSNLALTYQKIERWAEAQEAIEKSLAILEAEPESNKKILAQTYDIQGNLQREKGQSTDALNTWQKATKIYTEINEEEKVAQSKINQAQAMQDLGLYPRACQTLLEVFEGEFEVKNCQELGQELNVELETINSAEITSKLTTKLEIKSPLINSVIGLRSLGDILRQVGQLEHSEIILETSLNLAQKLDSPLELAATYISRGNTAIGRGNTAQAIFEGETIPTKRRKYKNKALDSYEKALDSYIKAIEVAQQSNLPTTKGQAQLNQLSFLLKVEKWPEAAELLKMEKWPEAAELWRSLKSELPSLPPSRGGVDLKINLAQTFIDLTREDSSSTFGEIDQILAIAAQQAESLGYKRSQAYALGYRGKLYKELRGDLSTAEELTKQALRLVPNFESNDIAYQFFRQLGQIRNAREDFKGAIAAYTKSFNALQSLRGDLVALNPEVRFSFRESVEPVYRELVDLDLKQASILRAGKEEGWKDEEIQKLLTQARDVIESLQLAELNNFFREACVEANPEQIDEIDENAAVIYPIILEDRLEILLSLPDSDRSLRLYTTKIKKGDLSATVKQLQGSLSTDPKKVQDSVEDEKAKKDQDFLKDEDAKKVYNWLIQPLKDDLEKSVVEVKTLVFVLDGELRNIPMAALHDGNEYLVQNYAIALTPGLQLLDPKSITQIQLKVFTAGLSDLNEDFEPHGEFDPLPDVVTELEQIQKVALVERSLLDRQFKREDLKQEIDKSSSPIIHLATHGKFSSRAEDTFILTWDERINIKQLNDLLRGETSNRREAIELLVLSACETARGDERAALGLAGVAVRAGVRSTLATLWPVADDSTAEIMTTFYSELKQSQNSQINKAEALRQAQLDLIGEEQHKQKQHNHPYFWAPFVLLGNWQ